MNQIPWGQAVAVFLGTLPIFSVIVWNLIEVKGLRGELIEIRKEIANIRERLATLEERDRLTHPILTK
jgi:hypothetical protein